MFRFLTIIAIIYGSVYPCLVSGQNLEWTFQYVTDYSNYGITADNSGEYIYEAGTLRSMLSMETGDTINFNGAAVGFYINKFNSKGDLIWTRTYNTRSKFHPYNVGIKGNEIWLTGLDQGVLYINDTPINHTIYHNFANAILFRFDQNGDFIDHIENPYTGSNIANTWKLMATNNNGYVALGGGRNNGLVQSTLYSLVNPNNEILYSLGVYGAPVDISIDNSNNVYTLINPDDTLYYLNKYDPSGKLVWQYYSTLKLNFIEVLDDNSIALLGNSDRATNFGKVDIGNNDSYLIKLDQKGKFIDLKLLNNLKTHSLSKKENNLYITGRPSGPLSIDSLSYNPSGTSDMYLLSLDESFKAQWDYSIQNISGINKNTGIHSNNNFYFSTLKLDSLKIYDNCKETEILSGDRVVFIAKVAGPNVKINAPLKGCVNTEIVVDYTTSPDFQYEGWKVLYNDSANIEFSIINENQTKFTPDKIGYYNIELTGIYTDPCVSKQIRLYRQIYVNDVMSTPSLVIEGDTIVCTQNVAYLKTPEIANVENMTWTMPEGIRMPEQKDSGLQSLIIDQNFVSGYVNLTVENYCDQIVFEPKLLRTETLQDNFLIQADKDFICPGDTVEFYIEPLEDAEEYIWYKLGNYGTHDLNYTGIFPDEPNRNSIVNTGTDRNISFNAVVEVKGKCKPFRSNSNEIYFSNTTAPPQINSYSLDYCKNEQVIWSTGIISSASSDAKVYWEFEYPNQNNRKEIILAENTSYFRFDITDDVYVSGYMETICETSAKSEPVFFNVINDFDYTVPEISPGKIVKCNEDSNPVLTVNPESNDTGYLWKISAISSGYSYSTYTTSPEFTYNHYYDANVSVARVMQCDTSAFSNPVFVDLFEHNNLFIPIISKDCFTLTAKADYDIDWYLNDVFYKTGLSIDLELAGEYRAEVSTECGVYSRSIVIPEGVIDRSVKVYNPTASYPTNFKIANDIIGSEVWIYTTEGKPVYHSEAYHNNKDLSEFAKGIYIYRIISFCDGRDYVGKIVVN
ncbi:MAG: hypothetical protein OEW75_01890 [Cyclobacteriaceae bacterium]|nr:hypothetical protein [Cyclobacteriaceae bacterium]